MNRKRTILLVSLSITFGLAGCDDGKETCNCLCDQNQPADTGDAIDAIDTGSNDDSEETDDVGVDTEGFLPESCGDEYYPKDEEYDYGPDYAKGNYGFKESLCWDAETEYHWGGGGDVMHDICLPNQDDEEVCLGDLYQGEKDLLIIGFGALW